MSHPTDLLGDDDTLLRRRRHAALAAQVVGDAEMVPGSVQEHESSVPPAAVRRGLLFYSAVLTAIGSCVAFGALRSPITTAALTSGAAASDLTAPLPPPPSPPTTVTPPTTAPPPPPPPPTSPPTWAPPRVVPKRAPIRASAASSTASLASIWACIRQKESGGNYAENTGNGYYGAYQFDLGTWQSLGYPGRPDQAPPAEQDAAAQKLHSERGFGPWANTARMCGA